MKTTRGPHKSSTTWVPIPLFTDEETEAERGRVTCPSSHSNPRGQQHGWGRGAQRRRNRGSWEPDRCGGVQLPVPGSALPGRPRGGAEPGPPVPQRGSAQGSAQARAETRTRRRWRWRRGPPPRGPEPGLARLRAGPPRARGPRLSATRRALLFVVINY